MTSANGWPPPAIIVRPTVAIAALTPKLRLASVPALTRAEHIDPEFQAAGQAGDGSEKTSSVNRAVV